jgi:hypothetical protein
MKIALLISGNLRNWELCKESFNKFMNNIQCDLFIAVYNKKYSLHPYNLIQTPVVESEVTPELINYYFPTAKSVLIVDQKEQMKSLETIKFDPEIKWPFPGGYDIFSQYTLFQKGLDLIEESKYDIIIKTRFDNLYHNNLSESILQTINEFNLVGITNGGTPHVCDHLFIGRSNTIHQIPKQVFNCFYKKPVNCEHIHSFLNSMTFEYKTICNSSINRSY